MARGTGHSAPRRQGARSGGADHQRRDDRSRGGRSERPAEDGVGPVPRNRKGRPRPGGREPHLRHPCRQGRQRGERNGRQSGVQGRRCIGSAAGHHHPGSEACRGPAARGHDRRRDRRIHRAGPQGHECDRPSRSGAPGRGRRSLIMLVAPDFDRFAETYAASRAGVLRATLVGDLLTPVAAFMRLRHDRAGAAFLLESVEGGAVRGRYSMIGLEPDLVWRCQDGVAAIDRNALGPGRGAFTVEQGPPLESLRALIAESALPLENDLPPMAAGLFGYLGYDMVRVMERLPDPNPDALQVPDAILVRPTMMVVFDAVRDEISLITPIRPRDGVSPKTAYETGLARIEAVTWALERPLPLEDRTDPTAINFEAPVSNTTAGEFA